MVSDDKDDLVRGSSRPRELKTIALSPLAREQLRRLKVVREVRDYVVVEEALQMLYDADARMARFPRLASWQGGPCALLDFAFPLLGKKATKQKRKRRKSKGDGKTGTRTL